MKFLVGVLYSGENEFKECLKSIDEQTHKDWDRFVIKNKTKQEAHNLLYSTFMKNADKYDIFIKVDADMVLARKTFFKEIIKEIQKK